MALQVRVPREHSHDDICLPQMSFLSSVMKIFPIVYLSEVRPCLMIVSFVLNMKYEISGTPLCGIWVSTKHKNV